MENEEKCLNASHVLVGMGCLIFGGLLVFFYNWWSDAHALKVGQCFRNKELEAYVKITNTFNALLMKMGKKCTT